MRWTCKVFQPEWNSFVEEWAGKVFPYLEEVLGPYGTKPMTTILPLDVESPGSVPPSASFNLLSGQIQLHPSMEGDAGRTLEKLTHEMVHGSLALFPSNDEFYDEGYVDYSTLLLSDAPLYGKLGSAMKASAQGNIQRRVRQGFAVGANRYDQRRARGSIFAKMTHGDGLLSYLKSQKLNGSYQW
jgi:hypothetical protein